VLNFLGLIALVLKFPCIHCALIGADHRENSHLQGRRQKQRANWPLRSFNLSPLGEFGGKWRQWMKLISFIFLARSQLMTESFEYIIGSTQFVQNLYACLSQRCLQQEFQQGASADEKR
jgi:hypothetical protein